MKKILCTCLLFSIVIIGYGLCPSFTIAEGNITAAEYSLDCGAKYPYAATWYPLLSKDGSFDSTVEDVEFSIDVSGLKIGFHTLCIRMMNDDGWGTPRKAVIEVKGEKYIAGFEYFIDSGAKTFFPVADCTNNRMRESTTANISIPQDLPVGLHTLYVRAQDSEDHWGTTRKYRFEVVEPQYPFDDPPTIISAAEFFVDIDPSQGDGIPMNAEDGSFDSFSESLIGYLDTSYLDIGLYTLYVRGMDSYGRWGVEERKCIIIPPPDPFPPETIITSGPGGNICTQSVTFQYTGSDNMTPTGDLLYSCKLEGYDSVWSDFTADTIQSYDNLPVGIYTFYVKSKDEAGLEDQSPESRSFDIVRYFGEMNGDCQIDISDVILVLRLALQLDPPAACSDINEDGQVDISDVILTLRSALGLDPILWCL
jgi:hypothetical protein